MYLENLFQLALRANNDSDWTKRRLNQKQTELSSLNQKYNCFIRYHLNKSPFPAADLANSSKLPGLTFAVKDNFSVADSELTLGAKPPLFGKQGKSAAIVQTLESLGAVLCASCNLDELALDYLGFNSFWGPVENPLFPEVITGGSSSGCAAAVACNAVDFAIGTDSGGSIRIPAACCGVSSIKYSPSVIPTAGAYMLPDTIDCIGAIAKSVQDLLFLSSSILENPRVRAEDHALLIPSDQDLTRCDFKTQADFEKIISRIGESFKIKTLNHPLEFEEALIYGK